MLTITSITEQNIPEVEKILKALDLEIRNQSFKDFFLAFNNNELIGISRLKEYDSYYFLDSFGIKKKFQNQKFGKKFIIDLLASCTKPVYLYTIVPEFFKKCNFKIADNIPNDLPVKDNYFCESCEPNNCKTMVYEMNL